MNRPFGQGLSYLDMAKSGIERFFDWFGKAGKDRENKFMLLTYGAFPHCIKSNFEQSSKHLLNELSQRVSIYQRSRNDWPSIINIVFIAGILYWKHGRHNYLLDD
jgi:hypothetical protein